MRGNQFPLSDRNAHEVLRAAAEVSNTDHLDSAVDRIAALRQQFMNFRKQSEVMSAKPLEINQELSAANLTA